MKPSEMAMVVDNAKETFLSARDDLAETDVGKKVGNLLNVNLTYNFDDSFQCLERSEFANDDGLYTYTVKASVSS